MSTRTGSSTIRGSRHTPSKEREAHPPSNQRHADRIRQSDRWSRGCRRELPEGAEVTLLALDGEETFEVDAELEAVLLESIAQGRRGETISAEALIREMRSRE